MTSRQWTNAAAVALTIVDVLALVALVLLYVGGARL